LTLGRESATTNSDNRKKHAILNSLPNMTKSYLFIKILGAGGEQNIVHYRKRHGIIKENHAKNNLMEVNFNADRIA
jgi:hypothetical protein